MATVRTNPLVNGLSGMLGHIVFKNYKGNTIVTSKPRLPQTQSTEQKANRSKFRQATAWAKNVLLDPAMKEYYQKKAKKLKLPNAYTAAITDYMRKPKLHVQTHHDKSTTVRVFKKDFELKAVEVTLHDTTGATTETRVINKDKYGEWSFEVSEAERKNGVEVKVVEEMENVNGLRMGQV